MGALLKACRTPEEEEEEEEHAVRVGERWTCEVQSVYMDWQVQSPWQVRNAIIIAIIFDRIMSR